MANDGIWIVNEDEDDQELIREILEEINVEHEVIFFDSANKLLSALEGADEGPFIIMSDVNLSGTDGFDLRDKLLSFPNKKFHSVPFIFWSSHASEAQVERAFKLRAHGFFVKEPNFNDWKQSFTAIIRYWSKSKMPSKVDAPEGPVNGD